MPPNTDDNANTIANAVKAALDYLKNGCYDASRAANNSDVKPLNSNFAQLNNSQNYTNGWGSKGSIHSGSAVESSTISLSIPLHPYNYAVAKAGITSEIQSFVVKYYGAEDNNRVAITSPTNSVRHVLDAPVYAIGGGVNLTAANNLLGNLPKCPPQSH